MEAHMKQSPFILVLINKEFKKKKNPKLTYKALSSQAIPSMRHARGWGVVGTHSSRLQIKQSTAIRTLV